MTESKYKNVSYDELISYAANNPNRTRKLESIEITPIKASQETSLDSLGLRGYQAFNLNPTGILSLFACIENPGEYSIAARSSRAMSISTLATKLQEQTENLKNTSLSRKRKKLHDLIGAAYNGSNFEDGDYYTLFNGLGQMCGIQFVLMKSNTQNAVETGDDMSNTSHKGEIIFSSNPCNWSSNVPTWIADYRGRWVAIPTENTATPLQKLVGHWLGFCEGDGWFIEWPEIEGTKDEIVAELSTYPTWSASDKSHKKEILAKRLGKAYTIKMFASWIIKIDSSDRLENDV
jgi:hypothetical protein